MQMQGQTPNNEESQPFSAEAAAGAVNNPGVLAKDAAHILLTFRKLADAEVLCRIVLSLLHDSESLSAMLQSCQNLFVVCLLHIMEQAVWCACVSSVPHADDHWKQCAFAMTRNTSELLQCKWRCDMPSCCSAYSICIKPLNSCNDAIAHMQQTASADQMSLGWQLQKMGPGMLGRQIWRLWPDDCKWYPAMLTHFYEDSGKYR